ncbi:Ankyrin [Shewanella woodyi ATCC 51908]|uniref:Ankyrin n=2 Tax=Shewanella woodyi TaxID=60961 RepID=B1KE73_SHEWM|nr:Ankyrin [Shewanella woodyi ATCC 51908]
MLNGFEQMRFIITFLIFFSGHSLSNEDPLADNKVTCEEMETSPELVFKLNDLGSGRGSPNEVDYYCPKSLNQLGFLQKVIAQAGSIRSPSWLPQYCTGTIIYAQRRYYHFSLAKLGYFPQGSSFKKNGKTHGIEYSKEWSYQSLYNREIYTAYIKEVEAAKPKLEEWYIKNHHVTRDVAKKYTDIALQSISNYGFGSYFYNWTPEPLIPFTEEAIKGNFTNFLSSISSSSEPQKLNSLRRLLTHQAPTKIIEKLASTIATKTPSKRSESIISSSIKEPLNVKALLDSDFPIDHQNEFGKTALFYAIQFNQHDSVKLLLSYGANVNHTYQQEEKEDKWSCSGIEQWGRTPLMHAAQHSDIDMLNLLINNQADIKAKDIKGSTAFDYAENSDKKENASFLLKEVGALSI